MFCPRKPRASNAPFTPPLTRIPFAVEAFEEVSDSLCVPQYNKDGEERVILFLKMASSHAFSRSLVRRIQDAIRQALSARHVPSLILETKGIPVRQGTTGCLLLFSLSP